MMDSLPVGSPSGRACQTLGLERVDVGPSVARQRLPSGGVSGNMEDPGNRHCERGSESGAGVGVGRPVRTNSSRRMAKRGGRHSWKGHNLLMNWFQSPEIASSLGQRSPGSFYVSSNLNADIGPPSNTLPPELLPRGAWRSPGCDEPGAAGCLTAS